MEWLLRMASYVFSKLFALVSLWVSHQAMRSLRSGTLEKGRKKIIILNTVLKKYGKPRVSTDKSKN